MRARMSYDRGTMSKAPDGNRRWRRVLGGCLLSGVITLAAMHRSEWVPVLARRLAETTRDAPESTRWRILVGLSGLGPLAVPALEVFLSDRQHTIRSEAAGRLGRLGAPARVAIPGIVHLLDDFAPIVGQSAHQALEALGPPGVRALLRRSEHLFKRPFETLPDYFAYWTCGGGVIPALIECLKDPDPLIRERAARRMPRSRRMPLSRSDDAPYDCEPAIPVLRERLDDPEPIVRLAAARTLGRVDRLDDRAVAVLVESLSLPAASHRLDALEGLSWPRGDIPDVRLAVERCLSDPDALVRAEAVFRVGQHGFAHREPHVPPRLVTALKDRSPVVRRRALEAIGCLGPYAANLVAPLIQHLSDPEPEVVETTCEALRCIGPGARAALPRLQELRRSGDSAMSIAAARAVEGLESTPGSFFPGPDACGPDACTSTSRLPGCRVTMSSRRPPSPADRPSTSYASGTPPWSRSVTPGRAKPAPGTNGSVVCAGFRGSRAAMRSTAARATRRLPTA